MNPVTEYQENALQARAHEERVFAGLLFFHAARRALDKLDALATDLDPKNEQDLLAFELFQGTSPGALLPLADADTEPWIRHALLKAFLNRGDTDGALGLWNKCLQWQVPDTLSANLLIPYLLREGAFEQAGTVSAVSLKLANAQRDVTLWKAQAQAAQRYTGDLYLDPLPRECSVAVALPLRDNAPYLRDILAGVVEQYYPITELILVEDAEDPAFEAIAGAPPCRAVRAQPGESWIARALAETRAEFLATLPATCALAIDALPYFMLALEHGAERPACAGGRVEDFHQDKPGDRWRVARLNPAAGMARSTAAEAVANEALCIDTAAFRALNISVPREPETIGTTTREAGGETHYIPEAVACCLREDTIESALDTFWQRRLAERLRAGAFASPAALVTDLATLKEAMVAFINDDIDQGNTSLVFPDFFLFFHNTVLDLQYGVKRGLLDEAAARAVQDAFLGAIGPMDARYKRDLRGKVEKMLGKRLIAAAPASELPPDLRAALENAVKSLESLFEAFPQDLYLAIYG
ncbi:MAG: glycosyltransferase family 2 protein [Candidatus Hydrogenedentes bacterium]|nr:glycosyltransferase family 2 protein [Candidatus Hydrogenedentota bacterium]